MEKTKNITNPIVTEYINSLYTPLDDSLMELRLYGEENNIPIILRESETFLKTILSLVKPKRILEIGTAIGYSSIFMKKYLSDCEIVSIEKNPEMAEIARKNICDLGVNDITILVGDAKEILADFNKVNGKFDLVFIDAAKSHYKAFFDLSIEHMDKGYIICDNILFQAKVSSDIYDQKGHHKTNIRNLREFNEYITTDKRFETSILSIGDGMSITRIK